jgi:hypothetical protein
MPVMTALCGYGGVPDLESPTESAFAARLVSEKARLTAAPSRRAGMRLERRMELSGTEGAGVGIRDPNEHDIGVESASSDLKRAETEELCGQF